MQVALYKCIHLFETDCRAYPQIYSRFFCFSCFWSYNANTGCNVLIEGCGNSQAIFYSIIQPSICLCICFALASAPRLRAGEASADTIFLHIDLPAALILHPLCCIGSFAHKKIHLRIQLLVVRFEKPRCSRTGAFSFIMFC